MVVDRTKITKFVYENRDLIAIWCNLSTKDSLNFYLEHSRSMDALFGFVQ
jgi:hypothetical protein